MGSSATLTVVELLVAASLASPGIQVEPIVAELLNPMIVLVGHIDSSEPVRCDSGRIIERPVRSAA